MLDHPPLLIHSVVLLSLLVPSVKLLILHSLIKLLVSPHVLLHLVKSYSKWVFPLLVLHLVLKSLVLLLLGLNLLKLFLAL
jgi:hypothetical protein